jgi:hypothetical protein
MAVISISKIQVRRGQELQTGIPQLSPGEFGWAEDTEHLYIGKRIIEGAVDDTNSRILTQKDLEDDTIAQNVFSYIQKYASTGTAVASTSSYKYRDKVSYVPSTTSTIAIKLDNWVSLTDFGVKETSTGTDITTPLQLAIYSLFQGKDSQGTPIPGNNIPDTRRQLIIPAGNYVVTEVIDLPPFTSIIGEGQDLTTIQFNPDPITNPPAMFRTVDANGNSFTSGTHDPAQGSGLNARNISIEKLTLQYVSTNTSDSPLLSLDEVINVDIKNVNFRTSNSATTATVYGTAIKIQSSMVSDPSITSSGNINIERCKFTSLNSGIVSHSTGTINRFYIKNCVFNYLKQGISIWSNTTGTSTSTYYGAINGVIDGNLFEKIVYQAIVIGTSTYSSTISDVVSSNNTFRTVGNGADITGNPISDKNVLSLTGPVILFNSRGNKIVNDTFSRQKFAEGILSSGNNTTFYYNPLVLGSTIINDSGTRIFQSNGSTSNMIYFPMCARDQLISIRYQMYNDNYSRKGTLWVNIVGQPTYADTDSIGSVSDYYNFSYIDPVTDPTWNVDNGRVAEQNYVSLQINVDDFGVIYTIEYQIDIII